MSDAGMVQVVRPERLAGAEGPAAVVLLEEDLPEVLPADEPGRVRRLGRALAWACGWLFGVASLVAGLAVLAAIPVLQFLTLGYLLEAGGRIGRTGRLRDGFVGVRKAARLGGIVLGAWLVLLPLRYLASLARDAQLVAPDSAAAGAWKAGMVGLTILATLHIALACARGGKLRYFFWPFNFIWLIRRLWQGGFYAEVRDAAWDFVVGLRLPYYFWLGLRGFVGAMAWLIVPISLLAIGSSVPRFGFVIAVPAALLLAFVLLYLPFLQLRFAAENRLAAIFEFRAIRQCFQRAPWAFAFSLLITLLFALPLYLLKIEMVPREVAWLPSLVFIVFIFPARFLTGWAYARSRKRSSPRHWFFRWTGRLAMLPVVLFYVLIVYLTQFAAWHGVWSLYEQHAFLLPVPFVSM
jgi:hypothetical protein